MNKQTTFLGGAFPQFLHAHYQERTYFQTFFIIILICASWILFPWKLNILYILYITWSILLRSFYTLSVCRVRGTVHDYLMKIFIIKKLYNISLIKGLLHHLSDIY